MPVITDRDRWSSVSATRMRSSRRTVDDQHVSVRQDDFEERREEFQRFLIQQRRAKEQRAGTDAIRANRSSDESSSSAPRDVPPFLDSDGRLIARRHFVRRPDESMVMARAFAARERHVGVKHYVASALWEWLVSHVSTAVSSKYAWILIILVVLSARRLINLMAFEPLARTSVTPLESATPL